MVQCERASGRSTRIEENFDGIAIIFISLINFAVLFLRLLSLFASARASVSVCEREQIQTEQTLLLIDNDSACGGFSLILLNPTNSHRLFTMYLSRCIYKTTCRFLRARAIYSQAQAQAQAHLHKILKMKERK